MSKGRSHTAQMLMIIVLLLSLPFFYFLFSKVLLPHFWVEQSESVSAPATVESPTSDD